MLANANFQKIRGVREVMSVRLSVAVFYSLQVQVRSFVALLSRWHGCKRIATRHYYYTKELFITMADLTGEEISRILASTGNVVKCVLLRAAPDIPTDDDGKKPAAATATNQDGDSKPCANGETRPENKIILKDLIDEIEVDTTPKKSQAQKVLGGPITFLGQYEDEDLVLVCRRPESLEEGTPWNPHKLQPPFDNTEVQGNILIMRTKPHDEESDEQPVVAPSDTDDFFLDFTKDDYIQFALRDDVEPPEFQEVQSGDEEEEAIEESEEEEEEEEEYLGEDDDDDEDDEEAQVAMMNLIMAQVLRRFHEENGRGPTTPELLELRSALAQKLGVEVPEIEDDAVEEEEKSDDKSNGKRAAENDGDEGETKRVKFSQEAAVGEEANQKQEETEP